MADSERIAKILLSLHERKVVDLDTPIRKILTEEVITGALDASTRQTVLVSDHYAVVVKGQLPNLNEIERVSDSLRALSGEKR